jgi:hypothetical protein
MKKNTVGVSMEGSYRSKTENCRKHSDMTSNQDFWFVLKFGEYFGITTTVFKDLLYTHETV